MNISSRTDEIKDIENEMVEVFCERYASQMVRASPEEIIHMWLDWQYERFKFKEQEDDFVIYDFEAHKTVAIICKNFPAAKRLAYEMCDVLNSMSNVDQEIDAFQDFLNKIKGDIE